MSNEIEVKPIRSFELGGSIRTPRKGAFLVDARMGEQLRVMGLVSTGNASESAHLANTQEDSHPEVVAPRRGRRAAQSAGQDE